MLGKPPSIPPNSFRVMDQRPATSPLSLSSTPIPSKAKISEAGLRRLNRTQFSDIVTRTREAYDRICSYQLEALRNPSPGIFLAVSEATNEWNNFGSKTEA